MFKGIRKYLETKKTIIHYSSETGNFTILRIHNKLLQAGLYLEKKHPKGILNKYKILDKIFKGIEHDWEKYRSEGV